MRPIFLASSIACIAIATLLPPGRARADAIEGPPACPPGSRGTSSHAGQWCVPWPCTSDAECEGGSCRPWRVCTRPAMVPPGGLGGIGRPPVRVELVVGTCDPARACTGTEEPPPSVAGTFEPDPPTCTEARACVPSALPPLPPRATVPPPVPEPVPGIAETPSTPPPPASPRGCACSPLATRAALAPITITIGVLLLIARRRR